MHIGETLLRGATSNYTGVLTIQLDTHLKKNVLTCSVTLQRNLRQRDSKIII